MKIMRRLPRKMGILILVGVVLFFGPVTQGRGGNEALYTGFPISLNLKDADVVTVLHLIAEEAKLNLVVGEDVKGTVDVHLVNVPWDQALDEILRAEDLVKRQVGNVLHVYTVEGLKRELEVKELLRSDAQKESDAQAKVWESQALLRVREDMVSRVFSIRYAKAPELKTNLEPHLSRNIQGEPLGSIEVNEYSNSLLVRDLPEVLDRIAALLADLDRPTRQVLIEARIVEANSTFARELGVQWGANWAGPRGDWGYKVGEDVGSASWTQRTGNKQADFLSGVNLPSYLVDLPAAAISGINPAAAGISIGRIAGDILNLDLRLTAAESEGLTKILSRPKIVAMDNFEATIARGEDIPYILPQELGKVAEVQFEKAQLQLRVRPHVIDDQRVAMDIALNNDAKTDEVTIASTSEFPIISRQEATTRALLRNGETVVLGGIVTQEHSEDQTGVPGLMHIPLLSWLFKTKGKTEASKELLIFITTWILEGEGA
jgi:type IV pilus assembly protein PilQ